jgi:hypothetical protein
MPNPAAVDALFEGLDGAVQAVRQAGQSAERARADAATQVAEARRVIGKVRDYRESRLPYENELAKRSLAQWRADDAATAARERERARINHETRERIRFAYADAFSEWGAEPPLPLENEPYDRYRSRLLQAHVHRLPAEHEFAKVEVGTLAPAVRDQVERIVLSDSIRESRSPSGSNLPDTVADPRAVRNVIDHETGRRETRYFARTSFIKALTRPGGIVQRVTDGAGRVLLGKPFPTKAA